MELGGRVALVTGGAGGIGGAVARSLARSGISGIGINYRKSAQGAAELAAEIERSGVKAMAGERILERVGLRERGGGWRDRSARQHGDRRAADDRHGAV